MSWKAVGAAATRQVTEYVMLAGFATAVAGICLIFLATLGQGVLTARAAAVAVVLAALVEVLAGSRLTRRGGPGMAHVVGGLLAVAFGLYVPASALFDPLAVSPQPIALALGLFCFCNAVFRAIDIFVDRPEGALAESIDCAFTLALGIGIFATWREATHTYVGVAAGIELISGGVALLGSVLAFRQHPDELAYEGRADRLAHGKAP
jgi:uncharacterized membrane protein HdeD (DUF308 family)